jgi:protein-tyrosine phosphatase
MRGLTDLHCHLLPYVDDGAETMEETMAMLREEEKQGVANVIFTPHLRKGMFETPEEKIYEKYQDVVEQNPTSLHLYLAREHHYDDLYIELLKECRLNTYGNTNCVLLEFSSRHSVNAVMRGVKSTVEMGYLPIVAHVERYTQLSNADVRRMKKLGALIQVNAGSILGDDGLYIKLLMHKWMQLNMIDYIASDAHHTDVRKVNMKAVSEYMIKKMGKEYAERILLRNPSVLIESMR